MSGREGEEWNIRSMPDVSIIVLSCEWNPSLKYEVKNLRMLSISSVCREAGFEYTMETVDQRPSCYSH